MIFQIESIEPKCFSVSEKGGRFSKEAEKIFFFRRVKQIKISRHYQIEENEKLKKRIVKGIQKDNKSGGEQVTVIFSKSPIVESKVYREAVRIYFLLAAQINRKAGINRLWQPETIEGGMKS